MGENKIYLGDGAYAEYDGHGVALTAENGIRVTDRVYLEPEVIVAFLKLLGQHYNRAAMRECIGEPEPEAPPRPAHGHGPSLSPSVAAFIDSDRDMLCVYMGDGTVRAPTEDELGTIPGLFIGSDVQLSNKACPRYYSTQDPKTGELVPSKKCDCPEGRCWYDEQKARRAAGKSAIVTEFWLKVGAG